MAALERGGAIAQPLHPRSVNVTDNQAGQPDHQRKCRSEAMRPAWILMTSRPKPQNVGLPGSSNTFAPKSLGPPLSELDHLDCPLRGRVTPGALPFPAP